MSHPLPRLFATSAALAASLVFSLAIAAGPQGTVTRSSGPLLAQAPSGAMRAVAIDSTLRPGDTLTTGAETYAEVSLAGGGTVTMKPDTELRLDGRNLTLARGGLHVTSGAARVALETPGGSLDIRNATVLVEYSPAQPGAVARASPIYLASLTVMSDAVVEPLQLAQLTAPPKPPGLPAGLYVSVIDGAINLSNRGGTTTFSAGQFGYTANITKPPVVVPANPGLKFTPPPSFSSSSSPGSTGAGKGAAIDCEVR